MTLPLITWHRSLHPERPSPLALVVNLNLFLGWQFSGLLRWGSTCTSGVLWEQHGLLICEILSINDIVSLAEDYIVCDHHEFANLK